MCVLNTYSELHWVRRQAVRSGRTPTLERIGHVMSIGRGSGDFHEREDWRQSQAISGFYVSGSDWGSCSARERLVGADSASDISIGCRLFDPLLPPRACSSIRSPAFAHERASW